MTDPTNERVFSGVQPTGKLHLGNYLGALRQFVDLQHKYDCIYCVVDLHALTVKQDPSALRESVRETAAALIACGLNPGRNILFSQSSVAAHTELTWILSCTARTGWLNRMTQFKEKSGKNKENASVGLYTYPVLMAADILCYRARWVPVGDDQKQHVELAREIARKFNNDYAADIADCGFDEEFFVSPEPLIQSQGARIMSLKDGTKKMSKSDPADASRINLSDPTDVIARKIQKARTDPHPLPLEVGELEGRPEARNLVGIYSALNRLSPQTVLQQFGGRQFSHFKASLTEAVVGAVGPIGAEMKRLLGDPVELDAILDRGAVEASSLAAPVVNQTKIVLGLKDRSVSGSH